MSTVEQREISIPVGVVVEKRASRHPWGQPIWEPVSVFSPAPRAEWAVLVETEGVVRYHAATKALVLHRKETEALVLNLSGPAPELYVVLRPGESGPAFPYDVHLVTASSYDAQDYEDAGDAVIGKVAMPEPVQALVQAFVAEHHVEEVFKKRRRDKHDLDAHQFGKMPIFEDPNRR